MGTRRHPRPSGSRRSGASPRCRPRWLLCRSRWSGVRLSSTATLRSKALDVLELEAGQLAHDPFVCRDDSVERGQWTADIPGDGNRLAGCAEDRAEELARGRLAVRAGDAEDGVLKQPRTELDLTPDGRAVAPCSRHERRIARALRGFSPSGPCRRGARGRPRPDDFYAGLAKPPRCIRFTRSTATTTTPRRARASEAASPERASPRTSARRGIMVSVRIAALYDVHGNLPALEAVLAEIAADPVDRIVIGGDVVAGPMPRQCSPFSAVSMTLSGCAGTETRRARPLGRRPTGCERAQLPQRAPNQRHT